MNIFKLIITIILYLIGFQVFAQNLKLKKGENYYNNYSYSESIKRYEAVTNKTIEICRNLAKSYFNISKFDKSEEYWAIVVASSNKSEDDIFNYASVLAINKKYQEAEKWMLEFNRLSPNDKRGQLWSNNIGYYDNLLEDNGLYKIESLRINTAQQDFGTAYYKNKIVFASTRQPVQILKREWNWNELPYLDIYIANIDSDMQFSALRKFHGDINKRYHEGPASFNKNGDFMAFTRNNYHGKSQEGIVKLQLFTSEYKKDKWQKPIPMAFNSSEYSVGHGCLTEDGKTMYFASDMPGGYGGVDLYRIYHKADGSWTDPENLGNKINTEGNEMFPFIHPNGILFFASNGLLGLGGLDIFKTKVLTDGFEEPENIGVPINSSYDDFSFIVDSTMESGYFSSNRPEGKGDDDIYSFHQQKPVNKGKLIRGIAMDQDSNILSGVKVNLYDSAKNVLGSIVTTNDGKYEFLAEQDKYYSLDGVKILYTNGYNTADTHTDEYIVIADLILKIESKFSLYCLISDENTLDPLDSVKVTMHDNIKNTTEIIYTSSTGDFYRGLNDKKLNDNISYAIKIEKQGYLTEVHAYYQKLIHEGQYNLHEALNFLMDHIEEGMDLSDVIDINPIFFDLNKDNIRPDAAVELDKVVKVMNENPNIVLELGSHTDCRGTAAYNMNLSDRRAKSSANYIKDRISNPERIVGKGYGESKLKNKCECEGTRIIPCTEQEHQQNRRTEFKIIKI